MNKNTTATGILDDLHRKLDKSKRTGDKLTARCPAHEDKTPSLSVTIGDTGDCVVMHCFTGCATEDVVAALGWTMRDLFVSDATRPPVSSSRQVYVLDPSGVLHLEVKGDSCHDIRRMLTGLDRLRRLHRAVPRWPADVESAERDVA